MARAISSNCFSIMILTQHNLSTTTTSCLRQCCSLPRRGLAAFSTKLDKGWQALANKEKATMSIYNPNEILAQAFEQGPKQIIIAALKDAFNVCAETIYKWASVNDCSKRRNPIGSILTIYRVLWFHHRPACFQIKAALTELEYTMALSPITETKPFDALDVLDDLHKATRLIQTIQARQSRSGIIDPSEFKEALAELQTIGSLHTDRMIATPAQPSTKTIKPLTYNPRTPAAYGRS